MALEILMIPENRLVVDVWRLCAAKAIACVLQRDGPCPKVGGQAETKVHVASPGEFGTSVRKGHAAAQGSRRCMT